MNHSITAIVLAAAFSLFVLLIKPVRYVFWCCASKLVEYILPQSRQLRVHKFLTFIVFLFILAIATWGLFIFTAGAIITGSDINSGSSIDPTSLPPQ